MPLKEIPREVQHARIEYWPESFESIYPLVWATPAGYRGTEPSWDIHLAEALCETYDLPIKMDGRLMSVSRRDLKQWLVGLGRMVERIYPLPPERLDA